MKTIRIKSYCTVCDFEVEYYLDTNEHGFFDVPVGQCPNDLFVLNQDILGHIQSITDEVEDGS